MIDKEAAARVMKIIRKVFTASTITLEQEKRLLPIIRKAQSEDVALQAVDRMWNEGVKWPTGFEFIKALDAEHLRLAQQQPRLDDVGPWISFRDWRQQQDAAMQARVKRVFPSLKIEL